MKKITRVLLLFLLLGVNPLRAEDQIFANQSEWKYWDQSALTSNWYALSFDDSSWPLSSGGFAYNDNTAIGTQLSATDTNGNNLLTAYFRKPFTLSASNNIISMRIDLRRDDGAVVYLNGVEVLRENMPAGTISYSTFATSTINGDAEDTFVSCELNLSGVSLVTGTNQIAVEVHQRTANSSDLIFDLALYSSTNHLPPSWHSSTITLTGATASVVYSDNLTHYASGTGGDPMLFEKISGPEWLKVAPDGTLSGTCPAWMPKHQKFVFRVSGNDGSNETTANLQLQIPAGFSKTRRYRLSWANTDPSSTVAIGWEQIEGTNAVVHYGPVDYGRNASAYPFSQSVTRIGHFSRSGDIYTRFASLTNLQPNTLYYLVLQDSAGVSPRLCFRTASTQPTPFTFIAGGDSRSNKEPRRRCNRLAAKLRPLFIAFTGDMTSSDSASDWNQWLDDWQETISSDGRIYPILPHLGNHEERANGRIDEIFEIPSERYYAISFGGNLLRYYALNSEIEQGGAQTTWLTNDLQACSNILHKAAGYHTPMRSPRVGRINNGAYTNWAQPFFDYNVEVVFEADSHMAERTWPIEPVGLQNGEDGFVRNNTNGIVFAGEGCWGAPLRTPEAIRSWMRDTDKFYGFQWIHVFSNHMELFTPQAESIPEIGTCKEHSGIEIPKGMHIWSPSNGTCVIIQRRTNPKKTSYAQWQLDHWTLPLPQKAGLNDDPDGDGLSNFSEFSFGTSPTNPNSPGTSNKTILPTITTTNHLPRVRFQHAKNRTLAYHYQSSDNLEDWTNLVEGTDYTITQTNIDPDHEQVEIQLSAEFLENHNTHFIRIQHNIQ